MRPRSTGSARPKTASLHPWLQAATPTGSKRRRARDAFPFHGFREAQSGLAPPVATARDPYGVEDGGGRVMRSRSTGSARPKAASLHPWLQAATPTGSKMRGARDAFPFHGFRVAQSGLAPPVATARDPYGVEEAAGA